MWKPKVPSPSTANTGRLAFDHPGAAGDRQRRADRTRHAVDHPPVVAQNALAPLRELAAVADQDAVGIAFHDMASAPGTTPPDAVFPVSSISGRPTRPGGRRSRRARSASQPASPFAAPPRDQRFGRRARYRRRSRTPAACPVRRAARPSKAPSGSMAMKRQSGANRRAAKLQGEIEAPCPAAATRSVRRGDIGEGAEAWRR